MEIIRVIIGILIASFMLFCGIFAIKELCKKEPIPENIKVNNLATGLSKIEVDDKYICFVYMRSVSCLYKEE
jgi:hypothetical protein